MNSNQKDQRSANNQTQNENTFAENNSLNNEKTFVVTFDEKKNTTKIYFPLRLSVAFCGKRSKEELRQSLADTVRNRINSISEFMSLECYQMLMEYSDNALQIQCTAALFELLCDQISAYTEVLEMLEDTSEISGEVKEDE